MDTFHSEHEFHIIKAKVEEGKTFSPVSFDTLLKAIVTFILGEVKNHFATKSLKIKVSIIGEYNSKEGGKDEIPEVG